MDGTMDLTGKTELELRAMERAIGCVDAWTLALIIVGAWGGLASWAGRWS